MSAQSSEDQTLRVVRRYSQAQPTGRNLMGSFEILVLVAIQIAIAFFFVYWAVRLGVKHALRDDRKGQLTAQQQPPGG